MEEIVCFFGFAHRFRRIRRIGRPGCIEVLFEVFSSRQHGERDGENVAEAQFAQWRRLDPRGPPKPPVATAPAGAADRLANRLREPHGNLMAELSSASTTRSSGGRSPLRWKAACGFPSFSRSRRSRLPAASQSCGQSLVAAALPGLRRPLRGCQPLQSHQLRAEQHRTRRRPLKAGCAARSLLRWGWNCHCEERSDEAIQRTWTPYGIWIVRRSPSGRTGVFRRPIARNDDRGSTQTRYAQRPTAPSVIELKARELRIPIVLTFVALALAACNANQAINPSGQANLCASDPTCNPYNPSS